GKVLKSKFVEGFGEVAISPYRFFYKIKVDVVWIVAVWHGAQLPEEPAP
ncbi:MAG: type II toxin-antitoxin system RelE/ParE family toxin, partial [Deltaproteobacteria bacterium]|nr:type II toxin-antitoxin system RelE/ParE family toxin [Deltaproteobacteria bacterium]